MCRSILIPEILHQESWENAFIIILPHLRPTLRLYANQSINLQFDRNEWTGFYVITTRLFVGLILAFHILYLFLHTNSLEKWILWITQLEKSVTSSIMHTAISQGIHLKRYFFFLIRVTDRLHNKFSRSFFEIATPLLFYNPGNPVMHVFFYFDHSIMLRLQKHNSEAATGGVLKKHFSVKFRKFFVYSLKTSKYLKFWCLQGL